MEKTHFDERQENQLLRIEHVGSTLAWWGLLAAILAQWVLFGSDFSRLGGELLVFLPLSVYLGVSPISKGLRDRYWPAALSSKALVSLVIGITVAILNAIAVWLHPARAWAGTVNMFLLLLAAVSTFSFVLLICLQKIADRRARRLEYEPDEERGPSSSI